MFQNAPGYRTPPDAGEWESNPGLQDESNRGSCVVNPLGDPRLLSLVAEHSLSKREVAGPIPAEGLVWNIAGGSIREH